MWWEAKIGARKDVVLELADGLSVYALQHVDLEDRMAWNLEEQWEAIRSRAKNLIGCGFAENNQEEGDSSVPEPSATMFLNLRDLQVLVDDEDEGGDDEGDDDDDEEGVEDNEDLTNN